MRRSPTRYCYLSMPLDLHVLSLSLAFILSQDQTLRCYKLFLQYLSPRIPFLLLFGSSFLKNDGVQFTFLVLVLPSSVVYVILFKELFFLFETWRKGNAFFLFPPNFSGSFFSFSGNLRVSLGLPNLTGRIRNRSHHLSDRHLSRLRVQK